MAPHEYHTANLTCYENVRGKYEKVTVDLIFNPGAGCFG